MIEKQARGLMACFFYRGSQKSGVIHVFQQERNRSHIITSALVIFTPGLHAGHVELRADLAKQAISSAASRQDGHFDGPAELPRIYVDSSMRATPAPGKTITVRAGEVPSRALAQASCGDTIQLQAGATFDKLLLPQKQCDDAHWIIVRTSAPDAKLPAEGTGLTPCYAGVSSLPGRPALNCTATENVLAKIEFTGMAGNGPIKIAQGANHYRLIGLEVTRSESPAVVYNLIGPENAEDAAFDHVVFDRMWVHGTAHYETARGIMLSHSRYSAVIDSYFSDFHCIAKTGNCVDSGYCRRAWRRSHGPVQNREQFSGGRGREHYFWRWGGNGDTYRHRGPAQSPVQTDDVVAGATRIRRRPRRQSLYCEKSVRDQERSASAF